MGKFYRKSPNTRLERVDEETVLMRTDAPHAFALNDSAAVLWDALDCFERPGDLEALLREARGLTAEEARQSVAEFLDALVAHGLATVRKQRRVRKKPDIVAELVGNELIIASRGDRKVHLLNDSGALLWEALDQFGDSVELQQMLGEAWPGRTSAEIETVIEEFLDKLIALGLVEEVG